MPFLPFWLAPELKVTVVMFVDSCVRFLRLKFINVDLEQRKVNEVSCFGCQTVEKGQNFLGLLHTIQAALKFTQSGILKKDELGSSLP